LNLLKYRLILNFRVVML